MTNQEAIEVLLGRRRIFDEDEINDACELAVLALGQIEELKRLCGKALRSLMEPQELANDNRFLEGQSTAIGIVLDALNGDPTYLDGYSDAMADVRKAIEGDRVDLEKVAGEYYE